MILATEPCLVPSPKRSFQGKNEKASTRATLVAYTPDNLPVGSTQLVLQEKIVSEEREVRRNPKENFTKMDENGNLKNGVRVDLNQFDLVVVQESVEEIIDRKTEPTLEEGCEHHNFIGIGCRDVLTGSRAPLQHRAVWEKMAFNKLVNLIFITNGVGARRPWPGKGNAASMKMELA
jgi:hypothetical protein